LAQSAGIPVVTASVALAPQPSLRSDPPSSRLDRGIIQGMLGRFDPRGPSFASRYLLDVSNHIIFGYELVLEQQQPGTYLATFGKLGLTPLEMSFDMVPRFPPNAPSVAVPPSPINLTNWKEWTTRPLVTIPESRLVKTGDTILAPPPPPPPSLTRSQLFVSGPSATVPTVSGTARDFSAADAEMQLAQPQVTFNGTSQSITGQVSPNTSGTLVWLYFPNHGRYILSLASLPDLNFKVAGEVRGGVISLAVGADAIKLECSIPIADGDGPYHVYVLHDPEWEPTEQAQEVQFAIGSIAPEEIALLKRN
jgi:hypothetical protein